MDSWRRMTALEDARRFLIKWLLALGIHFIYTSSRDVNASLDAEVIHANVSAQGLYNSAPPVYPLKSAESRQTSRDTHGALFLICGVILGVPLGVLAVCGVREFLCAMYEKYRMEALRRHYLYRMKIPVTVPVR
ncbi:uncharacterized protein LOC135471546 isoform X2 [Liolophura sinensis]